MGDAGWTGSEPLVIAEYDPAWPAMFERLRDRIDVPLGPLALAIEHVGSTSVPGLAAKPVIDLDVIVRSEADVPEAVDRLRALGYEPGGRFLEIPGLVAPKWPAGEPRHHLYVVVAGSARHRERIALRDHLRSHPDDARRYAEVKRQLATRFPDDWESYSSAKGRVVDELLAAATRRAAP
jgi:GrpB-like predicted nucleotidyltransferase (UPF0157 family)